MFSSRLAAGLPIVPPVAKTLHYVPPNDAIGTLARVMTYVVFATMGATVVLAVTAGMATPGQSSTGTLGNSTCCLPLVLVSLRITVVRQLRHLKSLLVCKWLAQTYTIKCASSPLSMAGRCASPLVCKSD